jgi:FkbM family methyltransferase
MKQLIHKLIRKAGYELLNKEFMPSGISLQRDLAQNTDLTKIKTVFDIGANQGNMAVYFNSIFPNARILAFEPVTSTYELLVEHCRNFPRIKPYKFGFSDKEGGVKLYLQSNHGLNSINEEVNKPDADAGGGFEEIKLETIDGYCQREAITEIDLLKTDAEGLDLKIIKGGEALIKTGKIKYILSEVGFNEDNRRNTSFEEMRTYLYNNGYKLRAFYDQSNHGKLPYMNCANALFALQMK